MKRMLIQTLALTLTMVLVLAFGGFAESVSNELTVPFQQGGDELVLEPKAQIDTTIGMAVDPAQSSRGATVKYTITLTNSGAGAATGLAVDAASPMDVVGHSNNASVNGLNIAWTNLTVPENSFITLWFTVKIPEDAYHGQRYEASASLGDGRSASARTEVEVPGTGLELIKTADRLSTIPGQAIHYALTLDNTTGTIDYTGLAVVDALPEGMAMEGDAPAGATLADGELTWTVGSLPAGERATLNYAAVISPGAEDGEEFVNEAALTEPALSDSCTVTARLPVLALTKGVDDDTPEPGQWVRFSVTVRNTGSAAATGVTVTDELPDGMKLNTQKLSSDAQYDADNRTVTWVLDVDAGTKVTRYVWLRVPTGASDGKEYVNAAEMDGKRAHADITVKADPRLTLSKAVSNRTPEAGEEIKYTVRVTNRSAYTAKGVRVIDSLPFGLEIDEESITRNGDYDSADEEIHWRIDVPAGKTVSMTYWAAIPEDAEDGESYTNRAYIPSVDSARVTVYVTEGGVVPKTGIKDATVFPAAWWMGGSKETPPAAVAVPGDAEETAAVPGEPPEPNAVFAGDYARNSDLIGWLVAGRTISQPVFQLDNQYYMTHDAWGNDSADGAVFLDEHNQVWPRDVNLIVYGHNMKSNAMFGTLDDYRTLGYLKDHPVITFQTVYDETPVSYVPFAVFDASMSPGSAGYVKIRRIGFGTAEENAAYLEELKAASLFDIPVDVQAGDQLLTLVTCSYSHEDGRFVLVARRVREGETLDGLTGQVVTADKKV